MSALIGNLGDIDVSEFDGGGLDIIGTDEFDELTGTENGEIIDAQALDDSVFARGGNDLVIGGAGDDMLRAGSGDDLVLGGDGDDEIFGNFGNDRIDGGEGNDTIFGGEGNDTIFGDLGSDTIFGNAGSDVFVFDAEDFTGNSIDTVSDFELGEDSLFIRGLSENDAVAFDATNRSISVNGNDVINFGELPGASEVTIEQNEDGDYEII